MKLEYIKTKYRYFYPQEKGVQDPNKREGVLKPVCYIKELEDGMFMVEYYDDALYAYKDANDNQKPASKIILYPSGIEEVKYSEEPYIS